MWITRVSINNPVFATMVMVALCVLGIFSYGKLGVEQMPDISFPGAWMEVRYPGASAEAVEREVIKPMEEAANSIAGVKRITSRSIPRKRGLNAFRFCAKTAFSDFSPYSRRPPFNDAPKLMSLFATGTSSLSNKAQRCG